MHEQRLLNLCARPTGTAVQYELLRQACAAVTDWRSVLHQAEREGVIPLLHLHLKKSGSDYPVAAGRSLAVLVRQLEHRSRVLTEVLHEVASLLTASAMQPIFLKGSVLRHTVYEAVYLRPMRDIDILLPYQEAQRAQELLISHGFVQSTIAIPADHFHLLSLSRRQQGVTVTIEIHHGLYPPCPPWYEEPPVAELLKRARAFTEGERELLSMGDEEMLFYLYQHAIRMPLVYESFRLINIADIIGLVEKNFHTLDWAALRVRHPELLNALTLLHRIVPWGDDAAEFFKVSRPNKRRHAPPQPFNGWPKVTFGEQKRRGGSVISLMQATFFPSSWWLRIYYGASSWVAAAWCALVTHPRHIGWWYRLRYAYLVTPEQNKAPAERSTPPLWVAKMRMLLKKLSG